MKSNRIRRTALPLGLAGIMAVGIAAGAGFSSNAVVAAPAPDKVAAQAKKALADGKIEQAISIAEGLVSANPREAGYRSILGQAYLKAGRFESAAEALNDAMKLGDNSTRTALSLSLAYSGLGKNRDAVAILDDWRDAIPAADLGLAYALAGETTRGVGIMSDALRGGDNTPKMRQNLAYGLALDGRWREARIMAAQDVPADKLDERISGWAAKAQPEAGRARVASLIGAPIRGDGGMPSQLALNADSGSQQLAAETSVQAPVVAAAPTAELPAAAPANPAELAQYQPVSAPAAVAAPAAPVEAPRTFAATFADTPVVQPIATSLPAEAAPVAKVRPVRTAAIAVPPALAVHRPGLRPRRAEAPVFGKGSSHAVQLGSFSSEQGARRAWGYYAARNPELRNFKMTITPATVRGKNFWRVAAAGLDNRGAGGLCSKVKSRGGVCFAYATTGNPANAPAYAARTSVKAPALAAARQAPAGPGNARKK